MNTLLQISKIVDLAYDSLAGYGSFGYKFFPFITLCMLRHSLVACKVSAETADGLMSPIVCN